MEYETERTENIVCPHCGYEDRDSWEVDFGPGFDGDTTVVCGSCEKEFYASRMVDVCYTTRKLKGNSI